MAAARCPAPPARPRRERRDPGRAQHRRLQRDPVAGGLRGGLGRLRLRAEEAERLAGLYGRLRAHLQEEAGAARSHLEQLEAELGRRRRQLRELRRPRGPRELREPKEPRGPREPQEPRGPRELRERREPKEPREPQEPREPRGLQEPQEPKEPRGPQEPRELREPRGPQEPQEPKEPRGPQEPREPREPKEPQGPKEPRGPQEPREPRGPKEPRGPQEPRELRDPQAAGPRAGGRQGGPGLGQEQERQAVARGLVALARGNALALGELRAQAAALGERLQRLRYGGGGPRAGAQRRAEELRQRLGQEQRRREVARRDLAEVTQALATASIGLQQLAGRLRHVALEEGGGQAQPPPGDPQALPQLLAQTRARLTALQRGLGGHPRAQRPPAGSPPQLEALLQRSPPDTTEDPAAPPHSSDEDTPAAPAGAPPSRAAIKRQSRLILEGRRGGRGAPR